MTTYNVYMNRSNTTDPHVRVFEDVADMIVDTLVYQGARAVQSRFLSIDSNVRTICIGSVVNVRGYHPEGCILYDFEQLDDAQGEHFQRTGYLSIIRNSYYLWSYCKVSSDWFTRNGIKNTLSVIVPPPKIVGSYIDKVYDITIVISNYIGRRALIVDRLLKEVHPYTINVVSCKWGDELYNVVRKSKIILCVSQFEINVFPVARILPMLSCGAVIVSEPFTGLDVEYRGLEDIVTVASLDSMGEALLDLLNTPGKLEEIHSRIQPTLNKLKITRLPLDDYVDIDVSRSATDRIRQSLINLQGYTGQGIDLSTVKRVRAFYSDTGDELLLYPMSILSNNWKKNSKVLVSSPLSDEMSLFSSITEYVDTPPDTTDFSLITKVETVVPISRFVLSTLSGIEGYTKVVESGTLHLYKIE